MDSFNNINENLPRFKRKYRFMVKLFKDAKQVHDEEWLRRGDRPPLTITATATESRNLGGEVDFTFNRLNIEPCDEIWLGLLDGCGNIVEEWELCDVEIMSMKRQLEVRGCFQENPSIDEEEETTQILYEYKHMRNRVAGGKWTNWSVI